MNNNRDLYTELFALQSELSAKQARIDELMFEHEPCCITEEQFKDYVTAQKRYKCPTLTVDTQDKTKDNQHWDMMNNLDWLISGGGWFENEIPLALNRHKRKKPQKVKESLTHKEVDFLKSTLNRQIEELHRDINYYKCAVCQDDESKELFWKLKNRDNALIKKLAEIQRKLKRGLPK